MTEFSSPRARPSPVPEPGPPASTPRLTAADPQARRRARRQLAGMFAVSAVLVTASVVFYLGFSVRAGEDGVNVGDVQISNLVLGLAPGLALLLAGAGVVRWSHTLMAGTQIVEHSGADDTDQPVQRHADGDPAGGGLGRRRLIRNSLLGALALLPLPTVVALRRLDPAAATRRARTAWAEGVRLLTDVGYRPIHVSDVQVGEMVSVMPATFLDRRAESPARLNERARSPVVLVRMPPDALAPAQGRENWHVDGIVAYSKICTHAGCPVSLYDRTTHHLLCPCHQATFDLSDNGSVVFGPATRPLPQLPLAADGDGYLVAQGDFTEPVGPTYWERDA